MPAARRKSRIRLRSLRSMFCCRGSSLRHTARKAKTGAPRFRVQCPGRYCHRWQARILHVSKSDGACTTETQALPLRVLTIPDPEVPTKTLWKWLSRLIFLGHGATTARSVILDSAQEAISEERDRDRSG